MSRLTINGDASDHQTLSYLNGKQDSVVKASPTRANRPKSHLADGTQALVELDATIDQAISELSRKYMFVEDYVRCVFSGVGSLATTDVMLREASMGAEGRIHSMLKQLRSSENRSEEGPTNILPTVTFPLPASPADTHQSPSISGIGTRYNWTPFREQPGRQGSDAGMSPSSPL